MSARKNLLDYMRHRAQKPLTADELFSEFNIGGDEKKDFQQLLDQLVDEGHLFKNSSDQYGIPEKFNLLMGWIERNAKGFSFLLPDDPTREDVFISMENMDGAMHSDKVFIRLLKDTKGKREEGKVVKVLERANKRVVGNLEKNHYFGFVVPDNKRIFSDVFVPKEEINGATQGQKVVAEIINWPEKNRNAEGKIVEILGDQNEPGVDIEAIIRQLNLPRKFSAEVMKETKNISLEIKEEEIQNRRDLRNMPMVTIDGADAKDLDDAVSIKDIGEDKVRLGVHIADVSHYVKEDSKLDQEALERGTSIYLVDRVIPMLPEKLSNGICSLNPGVDRLAMSIFMDFKLEQIELLDYEIFPSVIRTNYRMTYDEVREILVANNQEIKDKYSDFVMELKLMNNLREKLRRDRFENGSINFDFPEVKVILDNDGHPAEMKKVKHGISEQLIEEFMIAANRVVAEDMYWQGVPFIYRVHDQPELDSLQVFNEFIHNFGYHLKGTGNEIHPAALQEILKKVKDEPEERIIHTVLLKTMKKAVYTGQNIGHFGLALDFYTHFTSPIRRYPDLMIHRIIKEVVTEGYLPETRKEELDKKISQIADHSSVQERRALEAERDSVDLKKIEFMKDKIGHEYEGIISGVTGFGFFVELDNTIEGLVHVESLRDDYYHYKQDQQALIGERTKKIYRLGDEVKIRVDSVNLEQRELDFIIVD